VSFRAAPDTTAVSIIYLKTSVVVLGSVEAGEDAALPFLEPGLAEDAHWG
jgi:hypothetical protein